ncbi:Phosphatidylcholine-sterol acyltransferase [Spiroplasma sp. JKS002669]|uniref:SGNH/GDSL hydrolase family protein n=1 Tax=Spiroplasma attinicola TaxID=2904537 RepID=UPI0020BDD5F7|nr:SGNH/GDSL hydrolase family protein [Spiroplasma sp. JKS002669]MCL6428907.1 Phosphatidylcholine-sterol acyltransferase [Spiroplasma sp. JKS002669]
MRKLLLIFAGLELASSIILLNLSLINQTPNKTIIDNSVNYHQLYVVGDSLSDNGAVVGAGSEILKTIIGHGFTMDDPFYQNHSFSNGKVAVEILADKLELNLDAGWNFDFYSKTYNHIGNNYALGGAHASELPTTDLQGMFFNNFTINKQVDALLQQHKIEDDDLTFFQIGSNDFMSEILETSSSTEQESIIQNLLSDQQSALKKLIINGNKHILVMNTPDLGKIPRYRGSTKAILASNLTAHYNQLWLNMIANLKVEYPHYIKVFDVYKQFNQLLIDFAQQGVNIEQGATDYNLDLNALLNGKITPKYNQGVNFETINNHFFFDFVHPTELVHAKVGEMLYDIVQETW